MDRRYYGSELLSAKSKEEMFTPYKSSFAYGLYVDDCGNYYCDAAFYRFNARIVFAQDQSKVFIAFSNYYAVKSESCKQKP